MQSSKNALDSLRVSVVGLGYIGLPTAAMLASHKVEVLGVDIVPSTVEAINRGEVHIIEPDLDSAVRSAVDEGYLRAALSPEPADAFLIAVPTPFVGESHQPDLSYIKSAAEMIAPVLVPGNIVILESTSPVGTTEKMANWLSQLRTDLSFPQQAGENSDIHIAYCPERVLPGKVMQELVTNDRVIGGMTPRCSDMAVAVYSHFVTGQCIVTNPRTAEMTKLTENSFRDVNIAFANELSLICDKLDINVLELISLSNRHPRVNILKPGPGVGGHCIAVDPWFIVSQTPKEAQLIHTARKVNDGKPSWVIDKVLTAAAKVNGKPKVACFGLAFKPNIDDLRESPALNITKVLSQMEDLEIVVVEPNIETLPAALAEQGVPLLTPNEALEQANIILGLVAHDAFREMSAEALADKFLIDTCAVWS